jgi:HicA toxin of bacterial toxin-antitoxin,
MDRLAGFSYREVARRLRRLGFEFDRQAKGSHEICVTPATAARPRFRAIRATSPRERCEPCCGRRT